MTDIIAPTSLFALMLGLVHAFEADHIVAVSTMVVRSRGIGRSSFLGALWGMGHTTTLLIFGGALLFFRITIPLSLTGFFETLVALMLIVLGIHTIRQVGEGRLRLHIHTHAHGGHEHSHLHVHHTEEKHVHRHTPFIIGLFHGLAGSGALALAAIASTQTVVQGALFIFLFGVGSIIGMVALSAAIGLMLRHTARFSYIHTSLMLGSGTLCIAIAFSLLPAPSFFLSFLM